MIVPFQVGFAGPLYGPERGSAGHLHTARFLPTYAMSMVSSEFSSTVGSKVAGPPVGATFTGSIIGDTRDFSFIASSNSFLGPVAVYSDQFAGWTCTATYQGNSYLYAGIGIEASITAMSSGSSYMSEMWGLDFGLLKQG